MQIRVFENRVFFERVWLYRYYLFFTGQDTLITAGEQLDIMKPGAGPIWDSAECPLSGVKRTFKSLKIRGN
jgi:hypothetical protein